MYVYIHKELKINGKFCRCAIALDNFFYLFYFPNTRKLEEKETWVKNPGEVSLFDMDRPARRMKGTLFTREN